MRIRIASLLLLIALLLPSFAGAADTSASETGAAAAAVHERYEKQTAKLKALGLFNSFDKAAEEAVSRSDFAAVIMDLMGMGGMDFGAVAYLDVRKSHQNYNAVAFAKRYGVMTGLSEYQFDPDRTITYTEAVKTLLSAMGYGALADRKGGYPNGYLIVADSLNFDIAVGSLNWEQMVNMLVQALDNYILSAISIEQQEGRVLYSDKAKVTILSAYHNIEYVTGEMTDNGLTSLHAPSALDGKAVIISGEIFSCSDPLIRRALGCKLDFYYKEKNGGKEILWWDYAHYTEPLVLAWDELNTGDTRFTKTNVSYFENDKIRQAKVDPRAAFIYNEIAYPAFQVADMKLTNGTLTLCDGDGDGVYDILYADVYHSFRVKTFNNAKEEFLDDFNRDIHIADYETVEIYDDFGTRVEASAIAVNNVLSAFESKDKKYLKLRLCTTKATGIYQCLNMGGSRGEYTFDETAYRAAEYLQSQIDARHIKLPTLMMGERYRVHLDFNNDIAALDLLGQADTYAYFVAARKENGLSDRVELQVVLENGQKSVLPCADKVRVNQGTAFNAANLLYLSDLKDADTGRWLPQLVKIKINAQGSLCELETAPKLSTNDVYNNVGFDPYRFSMVFENQSATYYTNGRNMIGGGGRQYSITADTLFFIIPPDGDMNYVQVQKGIPNNLATTHMKGYDADSSYSLSAVVVNMKENDGTQDRTDYLNYVYIVKRVSLVADTEGAILKQLTAYSHSQEWRMVEQRSGIIDDSIKAGDIVRLSVDEYDRVTRCSKLVSTDVRPAPDAFNLTDTTRNRASYNGANSIAWGYPVGIGANSVTISTDESGGSIIHAPFYSSMTTFIEFDAKHLKYKNINKSQVPITASLNAETGFFDIPDKDTMVLVTTASSGVYDFILIKFGG